MTESAVAPAQSVLHTDIPLQRVLSLLSRRKLRILALDLLTERPIGTESSGSLQSFLAACDISSASYFFFDAQGRAVLEDSPDVAVIQDNLHGLQYSAKALEGGKQFTHAKALEIAASCRLLGGTDWQLVSMPEMRLVEDLTRHAPAVKPPFAAHWPKEGWAWTRSEVAAPDYSDCAWSVVLHHGGSNIDYRSYHGVALVCRPVPGVASPRQS